jgi:hypothetical protein
MNLLPRVGDRVPSVSRAVAGERKRLDGFAVGLC